MTAHEDTIPCTCHTTGSYGCPKHEPSGCGQDVDEAGACHTTACLDGEMIPASELPFALLTACEENREQQAEYADEVRHLVAEREAATTALREIEGLDPAEWHYGQGWQAVEFIQAKAREALARIGAE